MTNPTKTAATPLRRQCTALAAAVLSVSLVCAGASQAAARKACMPRAEVAGQLEKHKETPAAIGVASNGSLLEVFATADGATWSIIMTDVRGNSCVVAVGEDWSHRTPPLLGEIT